MYKRQACIALAVVFRAAVGFIVQRIARRGPAATGGLFHPCQRQRADGVVILIGKISGHGKLDTSGFICDCNLLNSGLFDVFHRTVAAVRLGVSAVQAVKTVQRKFRVLVGSRRIREINAVLALRTNQQVAVVGIDQIEILHSVLPVGVGFHLNVTFSSPLQCAFQTLLQCFHKGVFAIACTKQLVVEQTDVSARV